ncbi:RNA methyltransferase, TrmA family protein [Apilactobacillus kunkeei DSM 12361 = ATCC 700308]|uniref:RNA methyltransferase, TrmA family protein n=1 Tax=Apilactobacillus kunkeei DSM 12361 = ATCC 700308 TaxID=1423768 RepID=A0A0R1FKU9_9LACO|nr:23S rRNA (uracil(1939)-C(5))-methyltransferase RlmD [Apilactobacillus kunkeei]KOY72603.1 tRNA (Uracil-5-)-methyltransferase related enzyme [Apilactobacillus kunkeei DSM 12361 = ATCC 700308]KRK22352.1 RNA methyltransferase, TrmA family protein [Apilactobacillus kunkeei DSM 12361 = ATCC 700308]QYU52687.1 23S rRNA (uracil(1939)-C(5))-methyltransferase RlmD [Apilactobacillus kunkeei]
MKFKAPVTKNEEYEVDIIDLTYQGLGVAKIEDYPLFIEDTLPGEKALIKVIKVNQNFGFAKLEKLLTKSPDRVENIDKNYTRTGIAPLQHLKYDAQLEFKQHQIQELFDKSKMDVEVLPTIGMDNPTHYRNKAQIPVRSINGKLQTGFFRKHSHDLVTIEDFYIQDPEIDKAIVVVRDILRKYHIEPYNETKHNGVIRNIMVRRGHYTNEMMIGLITRTKKIPMVDIIVREIKEALPEVTSIMQNINLSDGNGLLGKSTVCLDGKKYIEDKLLGLKFAISLNSFYQVNPEQTEKLYSLAIEKAQLDGTQTVIDAYCGIGTISLAVAEHAKKVYGVEIVKEAIEDAKINAQKNHINNTTFVAGSAEEQMEKWQAQGLKPDVIMVDPPRKGLASSFIDSAAQVAPKKIVYVSCNPSTLVRDARRLAEYGYEITQPVQPVDQFPQTVHVESVTVFEKK